MKTFMVLMTTLINIASNIACPSGCSCRNKKVICQYLFLNEIPGNIPADTTALYLDGNSITHVDKNKLKHLTELQQISLGSNHISRIDDAAFAGMSKLIKLSINSNKLSLIKKTHFQNLTSLVELRLSKLSQDAPLCIEDYSFEDLMNLQTLSLQQTKIVRISNHTFYGLNSLDALDLTLNPIELYSSGSFLHLTGHQRNILLPGNRPLCCCQSKEAIIDAIALKSDLQFSCNNRNNTVSNGIDIITMDCIDDGDICGSIKESTCKIWPPPNPPSIAKSSSTISITSSLNKVHVSSTEQITQTSTLSFSSVDSFTTKADIFFTSTNVYSSNPTISEIIVMMSSYPFINYTSSTANVYTMWESSSLTKIGSSSDIEKTTVNSPKQSAATFIPLPKTSSSFKTTVGQARSLTKTTKRLATKGPIQLTSTLILKPHHSTVLLSKLFSTAGKSPCSVTSCPSGCSFSSELCKCVQNGSKNSCQVTNTQDKQIATEEGMSNGTIALIVGSIVFAFAVVALIVYLKKRQRRDRRFSMGNNPPHVELQNGNENVNGNDNKGFIIEGDNQNGNPSDGLY